MTATDEGVEAALESLGWPWTKRGDVWAVPANPHLPREVLIRSSEDGVRVEATLVEWDEGDPVEALTRFLERARPGLRGATCERHSNAARVSFGVGREQIDEQLSRAVNAIAFALRSLGREAAALLNADAARTYLEFHSPEK
jgi:hypothetical protein